MNLYPHLSCCDERHQLQKDVVRLADALESTRGQWIHSVRAPVCLFALKQVGREQAHDAEVLAKHPDACIWCGRHERTCECTDDPDPVKGTERGLES